MRCFTTAEVGVSWSRGTNSGRVRLSVVLAAEYRVRAERRKVGVGTALRGSRGTGRAMRLAFLGRRPPDSSYSPLYPLQKQSANPLQKQSANLRSCSVSPLPCFVFFLLSPPLSPLSPLLDPCSVLGSG